MSRVLDTKPEETSLYPTEAWAGRLYSGNICSEKINKTKPHIHYHLGTTTRHDSAKSSLIIVYMFYVLFDRSPIVLSKQPNSYRQLIT